MTAAALQLPGVGEVVGEGRFHLLRQLGEGGMSTVFVAEDRFLGREVALKLLIPRYVGRPEREQRLINEAEYLRRVQGHPNVIQLIDSGRLRDRNGWPWLSTEILVGEDLDWLFIRGKAEIPQVSSIARQTALALAACHDAGVVHRDLTPSNLFLLEDKHTIKLFDFSHAADLHAPKVAAGAPERLTGIFDTPGTIGYMGPEQVFNAPPEVSMDAFGFGVLLFKLVTGRDPYSQFSDRGAFIKAQREGTLEPPRLHAWAFQAPQEVADLVHDCTQRDGRKRPTMREIVARLDAIGASSEIEGAASETASETATRAEAVSESATNGEVTAAVDAVAFRAGQPTAPGPEVTAPVDAPALIRPRPVRRADPEVIGSWAVPRGPALAVPAPVAGPRPVEAPTVAPTLTALPSEEHTVELAFARPPQLREPSNAMVLEPTAPPPPEPRPSDRGASGDHDPARTEVEDAREDPAPLGPSRTRIVALVAGLGLLATILVWVGYSRFLGPQQEIADRDRSSATSHDPDAVADSNGAPAETEAGTGESDETAGTSGMEVVPQIEVEPAEQPENGKSKNGKPKNAKPKNANDPACEGVEADAQAAFKAREWRRVVKLTARKACWSSNDVRVRLRVEALFSVGDWVGCADAGAASKNAQVRTLVEQCQAAAAALKSPGSP